MAKSDNRITKLRKDIDKLRTNYTDAFTSANRAVYEGIEQLAEHELAAVKTHYEEALRNVRNLRKGGAPRDLAVAQLQMLQETVDRIVTNARESLSILDSTRGRINDEIRKSLEGTDAVAKDAGNQAGQAARTAKTKATRKAGSTTAEAAAAASDAAAAGQAEAEKVVTKTRPQSTAKKRTPKKSASTAARRGAGKSGGTQTKSSTPRTGGSRANTTDKNKATSRSTTKKTATGKHKTAAGSTTARKRTPSSSSNAGSRANSGSTGSGDNPGGG